MAKEIVRTENDRKLDDLRDKLVDMHGEITDGVFAVAHNMSQAGNLLTQAKALLDHGQWSKWVEDNCGFTSRTASRYLQAWTMAKKSQLKRGCRKLESAFDCFEPEPEEPPTVRPRSRSTPTANNARLSLAEDPAEDRKDDEPEPNPIETTTVVVTVVRDDDWIARKITDGKAEFAEVVVFAKALLRKLDALYGSEFGAFIPDGGRPMRGDIKNLLEMLKFAKPYAACPWCKVKRGERPGCDACKQSLWVSAAMFKQHSATNKKG